MSENKYDAQHACNYDELLKENARLKEINLTLRQELKRIGERITDPVTTDAYFLELLEEDLQRISAVLEEGEGECQNPQNVLSAN